VDTQVLTLPVAGIPPGNFEMEPSKSVPSGTGVFSHTGQPVIHPYPRSPRRVPWSGGQELNLHATLDHSLLEPLWWPQPESALPLTPPSRKASTPSVAAGHRSR
jgi:hypothetical protein